MPKINWQPTASLSQLKQRAQLYQSLRSFFLQRGVLEVETPVLGTAATVDPFIDSLTTDVMGAVHYLQTSPEFFLKRLLCAGAGDIYSLGKVFRQGEKGRRHHPEFTLLEWYRVGWDEQQLMDEVSALIRQCLPAIAATKISYEACFTEALGLNPHSASAEQLKTLCAQHIEVSGVDDDKNTWLDLLMTHCVEPTLPEGLVLVYDYPQSQAALAKIDRDAKGQTVARRFEAYVDRVELANGYFELSDASEQRQRFQADINFRQANDLPVLPYDEHLLAAMEAGMPSCAGVALGIDRLLMLMSGEASLQKVIGFCE